MFWNLKAGKVKILRCHNKFFPEKSTTLDKIALDIWSINVALIKMNKN